MVRRKAESRRLDSSMKSRGTSEKSYKATKPKRKDHILREIKYLQRTTKLQIPKLAFSRVVREIMIELFPRLEINRIQASALEALQESAEMYLTQFFEDAVLLSLHAKRRTLFPADMRMIRRLRGRSDVINK